MQWRLLIRTLFQAIMADPAAQMRLPRSIPATMAEMAA